MRLDWSDYKSDHGSRCVRFPGRFQLYVLCRERHGRGWSRPSKWTKRWRVTWYRPQLVASQPRPFMKEIPPSEMPGLTDRWFLTRAAAMRAAERVFVPILRVVTGLVSVKFSFNDSNVFKKRKRS